MKILITMMCALMLASCATDQCGPTKEQFLENYEKFVDKVESKDLTSDSDAWQSMDQKLDKYLSECYTEFENNLTNSERIDFASNTVRYYYTKYGKEISVQLGSDPEAFARQMSKNLEAFLNGNEDEIEALIDDFAHRLDRKDLDELIEKGSEFLQLLTEDLEN
ncbi:MAG: hypothetical protein DRI69_06320 [Bacteroidetes bacterium]|nr:MAG: hypothetical protein DRI69_06320 [Bacteroidota bacterium]